MGRVDRAPSHAATWNSCRPLFQFGTVALDPAPDCRVVRFQDALAEQLFDITQRERVPKGPAYGAKNQLGLRLPPLEDRRPKLQHNPLKAVFEILSTDWKIATCSIEKWIFSTFLLSPLLPFVNPPSYFWHLTNSCYCCPEGYGVGKEIRGVFS